MKSKIALACLLLSGVATAQVGTTAYVQPETHTLPNQGGSIDASHAYAIYNDSGVEQAGTVCMTTALCFSNSVNPIYRKEIQTCDRFDLQPGQAKNDIKNTHLPFNYPFVGYCPVTVSTEVYGWQHSVAIKQGRLHVGNDG